MQLIIRKAVPADIRALTDLTNQLGYPLTEKDILSNFQTINDKSDEVLLVGITGDAVVGWIHVVVRVTLESGSFAEICGLVVDKNFRGKQIGEKLVDAAKKWSNEMHQQKLRLRSNTIRNDAHRFYERLGFKVIKEQKVFDIGL
jgi:ribosomal protein S18 acetylase RimI-like enzyme